MFNKLIMHNFLSYAHSEYEFNKSGFIAVKGYNRNKEDNASSNGGGKCFGKDTKVLMYDGSVKHVQDIVVGDIVMGWDSTPRVVLETHSGVGDMYEVSSARGQYKYTCNDKHLLCLNKTIEPGASRSPQKLEISVSDFLNSGFHIKRNYCQYIMPVTRTLFNSEDLRIDPYFLGVWLGDGTKDKPAITTMDDEIIDYVTNYFSTFKNHHIAVYKRRIGVDSYSKAKTYVLYADRGVKPCRNELIDLLKSYNLFSNKHIPEEYLNTDYDTRLKLLAGLLDTDGCYEKERHSFEFVQKCGRLSDDFVCLARGLGFKVSVKKKVVYGKTYMRFTIFGDLTKIPTRVKHKTCDSNYVPHKQVFSFHPKISYLGKDTYYGFQISGDGKFLLSNGLVVHNSSAFNSIIWCLTGSTPTGVKDVHNRYVKEDETWVYLSFTVDGKEYTIKRFYKPAGMEFTVDGREIENKGIRDAENILSQYLPNITEKLLSSVIILGQGLPNKLTNHTPSGRKEILEQLSNSDFMIEDIKDRLSKRLVTLNDKKRELEDNILQLSTTIENNKRLITDYQYELNHLSPCDILESELASDKKQYGELSTRVFDNYDEELKKLYNEKAKIKNEPNITDLSSIDVKLAEMRTALKGKIDKYKELSSVTDVCPTCGQKLIGVHKPDTSSLVNEINQLKDAGVQLKNQRDKIEQDNNAIIAECNKKYQEDVASIQTSIEKLEQLQQKVQREKQLVESQMKGLLENISKIQVEIDSYNNKRNTYLSGIEKATKENDKYAEDLDTLKSELTTVSQRIDIQNKMNTLTKRDFRGVLLSNCISYLNSKMKEFSLEVFNTDKLSMELSGNNVSIKLDGKEYESLSGGEKTKVDIIIQLSIRDMLCKYANFSSNILVIDEVTDFLDEQSASNVYNLFMSKLNDVSSVYIISHRKDFTIPTDGVMIIEKGTDKISRIIQ